MGQTSDLSAEYYLTFDFELFELNDPRLACLPCLALGQRWEALFALKQLWECAKKCLAGVIRRVNG